MTTSHDAGRYVRRNIEDCEWTYCPACKTGSLDTGYECNSCGFDALPLVHLQEACEASGDRMHPSGLYQREIDNPIWVPATRPPAQAGAASGEALAWLADCDNLILFNGVQPDGWWEVRRGSVKGEVRGRGPTPLDALVAAMPLASPATPAASGEIPGGMEHAFRAGWKARGDYGLDRKDYEELIPAEWSAYTPKASAETSRWRERWYGSEPQKGSAIVDEHGNLIVYLGGDEETHRLTTAIVAAHNAALSAAPSAPATEAGEEA